MSGLFGFEIARFGPVSAVKPPLADLASRGEAVCWAGLVQLIGPDAFLVNVRWGDIEYSPQPDQRSAEFLIPALDLVILVNSRFTHPDPEEDRIAEQLIGYLGYRVEWVWDYEILPEMGGNVMDRLMKIPGLWGFGNAVRRKPDAFGRKRIHYHGYEVLGTGGAFQKFAKPEGATKSLSERQPFKRAGSR